MNPTTLKRLAGRFGLLIERKTDFGRLLQQHKIDLVLDVGANIGQTYDWLRDCGLIVGHLHIRRWSEKKIKK